jgi:glucose-6-phosphate 1-dehydrogenase
VPRCWHTRCWAHTRMASEMMLPRRNAKPPRRGPPVTLVIFGASGDLSQRKLVPALFDLFASGLLAPNFTVVGCGRSPLSDDDFRTSGYEGARMFSRHMAMEPPVVFEAEPVRDEKLKVLKAVAPRSRRADWGADAARPVLGWRD